MLIYGFSLPQLVN